MQLETADGESRVCVTLVTCPVQRGDVRSVVTLGVETKIISDGRRPEMISRLLPTEVEGQ